MPPPPEVLAGPVEDELQSLDEKIQSGQTTPADVQRYNDLLQMLQDQERKKPKNDFLKPRFRLSGHGQFQQGFGMTMNTPLAQFNACGEFKNIYYNCADLPWDATDGWTRTDETGDISVRPRARDDACVSDGVLTVDSRDGVLFWRMEEGLLTERYASAAFRAKQTLSERNPDPYTTVFGGGVVWIDDGVKSTAVGFVEDFNGDKLVLLPIESHPDPETGELNITEVLTAYHDWSVWHDYRLVRDAEGTIELLADGDPTPVVSYPYAQLNMGSLGGPAVLFGNLIEGQNARVLFEIDQFDYSVGMPNTDGCTSANGKMRILSLLNMNRAFNPQFESNEILAKVDVRSVGGLGGNGAGRTFFVRVERTIFDADRRAVRTLRNDAEITADAFSARSPQLLLDGINLWDGRTAGGQIAPEGDYTYLLTVSIVQKDKKLREKVLNTVSATGSVRLAPGVPLPPIVSDVTVTRFGEFVDSFTPRYGSTYVEYRLAGCSTGSDPVLDVLFNQTWGGQFSSFATNDDEQLCGCGGYWATDSSHFCSCGMGAKVHVTPTVLMPPATTKGIVRAKRPSAGGACMLERRVEGGGWQPLAPGFVRFGGNRADSGWNRADEIQTSLKDAGQDTLLVLAEAMTFGMVNNGGVPAFDDDRGVGAASLIRAADGRADGIVYFGQKAWAASGRVDLFKNDRGNDADGDGLGAALEAALGTCDDAAAVTQAGYDCSRTFNTQDTDGDGLSDYVETFGCDRVCEHADYTENGCFNHFGVCPGGGTLRKIDYAQLLPQWGANPLRKDIFIEIDIDYGMSAPRPVEAKRLYEKFNEWDWTNANPDRSPVVNMRFDMKIDPVWCPLGYCGDFVGDFGGFDEYPETELGPRSCTTDCVYRVGGSSPCPPNPNCQYDVNWFPPIRRGLFLFGLVRPDVVSGPEPGINLGNSFAVENGQDPKDLLHELGHFFVPQHFGDESAGRHNCKPNYTSVMNYFYAQDFGGDSMAVHFSDGRYQKVLNPISLCESDGLGPGVDVGFLASSRTFFKVENGGVDWNRDGVISDCTNPVKACVHCGPDCTALQHRFSLDGTGAFSDATPAAVSFGGQLYVFFKQQTGYGYRVFLGFEGCQDDILACDKWAAQPDVSTQHSATSAPSLAAFTPAGGQYSLRFLYRSAELVNDNNLWITTMDQDGQWASEEIPVGVLASQTYDPALVNYRGDLFVMYHDGTNALWQKQMSPEGEWGDAVPVTDGTGQQMKSCNSPALATRGLFKGGPSNWVDVSILHLVTAASASDDCSAQSHRFDTRYLDDTTGRWHEGVRLMPDETYTNVDWSEQKVYGTGKVGFAWQADGSISTGGRFYLFYRGKDDEPQYQFMTWEQGGWEWGMTGSLPGGLVNTGADITFHGGQGLFNIVGVYAMPTYPSVAFVPYVDGICNYQLRDWNDWQSISSRICRAIVRPAFGEQFDLNYCGP